jgi:hypothetical protein
MIDENKNVMENLTQIYRRKFPDFDDSEISQMVEIAMEEATPKYAVAVKEQMSIDTLAQMTPEKALQTMETRVRVLENTRKAAIKGTSPDDWVGFNADGNVTFLLTSSGAVKVRKYYGISTYNLRPDTPVLKVDDAGVKTAMIVGDGRCGLTGEETYNVVGLRRAGEHFTGRGTDEDLLQSARTSLETKIVRILAGMIRVPQADLEEAGIEISKCRKGAGFGTSSERKADKVTEPEVKELQTKLRNRLMKIAGGVESKASVILEKASANPEKGFQGFQKVTAMTQKWQIDQVNKKLDAEYPETKENGNGGGKE